MASQYKLDTTLRGLGKTMRDVFGEAMNEPCNRLEDLLRQLSEAECRAGNTSQAAVAAHPDCRE